MLTITDRWASYYPDAHIGILALRHVINPPICLPLEKKKVDIEDSLRGQFASCGKEIIRALPVMQAYKAYYRQFKKTYHVQQQVESIVLNGRSIPSVAALVEAMFMVEIKHMLLTAGHDFETLTLPIRIDVADGSEVYKRLNGQEQVLKSGDMYIADAEGVMSAIIYGPDQRTQITPATESVLYTVYAPSGIPVSDVEKHLTELRDNVLMIAPEAATVELRVYGSGE